MKLLALGGVAAIAAGGFYIHGPIGGGEVYARPASEVAYTLETMALPDFVEQTIGEMPSGEITRVAVPGKSVTYFFKARGGQAAKFVADIDAVDATHTRVRTRMEMADDAETLLKTQYLPVARMFDTVGTLAMREQIDARLEKRAYDEAVTKRAIAGFAIANIGAIQQSASEAMTEAAAMHDTPSSQMRRDGVTFVPGEPMVESAVDTDVR